MSTSCPKRRLPSLVNLCQRVASTNANLIVTLGDLEYGLVKPVLEESVETLERLENASPHLQRHTGEIWEAFCHKNSLICVSKCNLSEDEKPPENWRDRYYWLLEQEAKRISLAGNRLKSQQLEEEQRRKDKETKFTERVPPTKRPRFGNPAPKTLFQKTRADARKTQRSVLPALPTPPRTKGFTLVKPSAALPSPPSSPALGPSSRVKVATVVRRRSDVGPSCPSSGAFNAGTDTNASLASLPSGNSGAFLTPQVRPMSSSTSTWAPSQKSATASLFMPRHKTLPQLPSHLATAKQLSPPHPPSPFKAVDSRPVKPLPTRKDPASSLFIPKHRPLSQKPKAQC